ncbi:hypothetical protein C8J98_10187 [Luteibacter sp. OK325]|uniref:hypothetical protein n=1 Tax=Luteibacter sp. OK325 TaxID=2135670 RepID=UPI000D354B65|nr:hypothetical protein [Luteibacter sp. OK325]PTR34830.1 hypothetical protein C8J98_10187 [Luteibacter sp. OK325]
MPIPKDRQILSLGQIFDASYRPDEIDFEVFSELLTHVSQELGIPRGLLRPTDRFDVELAPGIGNEWDSGIGILVLDMQRFAKRKGRPVDRELVSLDDYLRFMSEVYE